MSNFTVCLLDIMAVYDFVAVFWIVPLQLNIFSYNMQLAILNNNWYLVKREIQFARARYPPEKTSSAIAAYITNWISILIISIKSYLKILLILLLLFYIFKLRQDSMLHITIFSLERIFEVCEENENTTNL